MNQLSSQKEDILELIDLEIEAILATEPDETDMRIVRYLESICETIETNIE
jgi:hypothetical protein